MYDIYSLKPFITVIANAKIKLIGAKLDTFIDTFDT